MESIKKIKTEKDKIINEIIDLEQRMFQGVKALDGPADCQEDPRTFYIMRYSQHQAFGMDFLRQYREDLLQASLMNRNLVAEKYAYMMEKTDPDYFEKNLRDKLVPLSSERTDYVNRIVEHLKGKQEEFEKKYPYYASRGRGLNQRDDWATVDVYLQGELKTYSLNSLRLMWKDLEKSKKDNILIKIHQTTVEFYGYCDLMEVEEALKK